MARVPTVFVVDDDEHVRKYLRMLLASAGIESRGFASAQEFTAAFDPQDEGCMLTDLELPGMSGLELERWLAARGSRLPMVFISGHATVEAATAAMRHGAIDFLEKPLDSKLLLERVREALALDAARRQAGADLDPIRDRMATLTPRETQLIDLLIAGKSSKQIAFEWSVSIKTIENHRAHVMRKMKAANPADLTRMVLQVRAAGGR